MPKRIDPPLPDDAARNRVYWDGYAATYQAEHGFTIDDLIELRPPKNAKSTYRSRAETDWARRWAAEHLWCVTKA